VARDHVAGIVAEVGIDALMDEMIERLTVATAEFDGSRTLVRARDGFHYTEPHVGLLEWMPVMHKGETTTIKVVGYHPSNPLERNLPTIISTISAYDTESGHLIGLVDGTFLTALRTGAASAVASRMLAKPDSHVLGLVGCGAQSLTQMHAILRSFPIDQVLIIDVVQETMDSFEDRAKAVIPDGVLVKQAPLDVILGTADIVCTSSSVGIGEGPLFADQDMKPWIHFNAVGSDFPGKVELPLELLERSLVCPDHRDQAVKEGECQQLQPDQIGPSLAELMSSSHLHEEAQQRPTVFDSTGWALEDRVAIQLMLAHSERLDLGLSLQLEDIGDDPLNPYGVGEKES
jgi:ornithine cyclodeaminase/alanine dehydrogenase-like protein (mu-crystallin family)